MLSDHGLGFAGRVDLIKKQQRYKCNRIPLFNNIRVIDQTMLQQCKRIRSIFFQTLVFRVFKFRRP